MRPGGLVLAALGVVLAARATLLLLGRGRPRRGPTPALIIAGPYVRARNPLLAGLLVALVGLALAEASWALFMLAAIAAAAAHAWVVGVEEPRLAARFGAAYTAYLRRVPRWVPAWQPAADEIDPVPPVP